MALPRRFFLWACILIGAAPAWAQPDPYAIWTQATLYRDEWGVPHVFAETPRALAFAFGYAQAEDHLEPMLFAYRVANGRAAETLGEAFAASDEFALKMGHGVFAQDALTQADPLTIDLCEGFAQGVNAWMVEHPRRVPGWADGVRPADILALLHCYLMTFAPFDMPDMYHPPPAAFSGNAWALAPSRSATGEAMLAINPHMYFDGPFRWYEAHLSCRDYNMAGATLFGLPVLLMGHNGQLGWALTPNQADSADLYVEPEPEILRDPRSVNPMAVDPRAVLYKKMLAHTRTYYVAGAGGMQARPAPCLYTSRGPIIGEHRGDMLSFCIGAYGRFGTLRQLVEMGRARDLAAFQAALALAQLSGFHVTYADRQGNVFYFYDALVGQKAAAPPSPDENDSTVRLIDWSRPVPANNRLYFWNGLVPLTAMPAVLNPPSGYVQACGNPPWLATENSGINPQSLPAWLCRDIDTYRAQRARFLLRIGARTFTDMQAMLYDIVVPFAVDTVPGLLKVAEQQQAVLAQGHPDVPVALQMLSDWNYSADTASSGMTFFHVWWAALRQATGARFRNEYELMAAVLRGGPAAEEAALSAAADAAKLMRNQYQSLHVPWGDVHRIRRGDREEALPGAATGEPLLFSSDLRLENGKWIANYGYGFAMVVKFGEEPEAVSVSPFGASENPDSPHYSDQLDLFTGRQFKPARFLPDDVISNAETAFGRVVELRPQGMEGRLRVRTPAPIRTRAESTLEPPAPLPEGLGTFTVYAAPRDIPDGMPMAIDLEVRIAPEVCDPDDLDQLGVYGYTPATGWLPLEFQELDRKRSTFVARDEQARVYAVLGPAELRNPEDADEPFVPIPERKSGGGLKPVPPSIFKIAEELPGQPAAGERVQVSSRVATPGGEPGPPLVPSGTSVPLPDSPSPVAEPEPFPAEAAAPSEAPAEAPPLPAEEPVAPAPPPAEATTAVAAVPETPPPAETLVVDSAALERMQQEAASASSAEAATEVKPEDIKIKAAGPVGSGRLIDLRTPDDKGIILISARSPIQARLVALEEPPAPLPEGMAVFTDYIGLDRRPDDARVEVTLKLVVPEGACAAENIERLRIYAFRPGKGWYEVPGQKITPETRTLGGIDETGRTLRVYTILGPAECRLQP